MGEESKDNEADMEGKECVADEAEDNELVDEVKQEDNLNIDDKVSVDKEVLLPETDDDEFAKNTIETGDIDIDEPGNEDKVMDEGEMGVEDTKEDDVVEDVVEEKNINIDESEDKDTLDDAALEADDVVMNEAEESRDNEADMEGKECVADEAEDNELVDEVKQEDNLNIDDKVSVDKEVLLPETDDDEFAKNTIETGDIDI